MSGNSASEEGRGQLSERARRVLYAVMTEFLDTGEPVASRTLSLRHGFDLSAATIRNVLKDLEDAGYLTQPHTSAGRVPTLLAFRVFIDALMHVRELKAEQSGQIRELFRQELLPRDLLRESGRLLSELSGMPAVVLRARGAARSVDKIRFIATRPGELLGVVVLDDGSVENRFMQLDAPLEPSELERLHNLLDELTAGRTLLELKQHVRQLAQQERAELGALAGVGERLLGTALEGAIERRDVFVEGQSTLLRPGADPESVKQMLLALEDRERLAHLLDRTFESGNVQVFLGDSPGPAVPGVEPRGGLDERSGALSVVAAPYGSGSRQAGAVGAVGPTRMDYPGLVPLVETIAAALSEALARGNREAE